MRENEWVRELQKKNEEKSIWNYFIFPFHPPTAHRAMKLNKKYDTRWGVIMSCRHVWYDLKVFLGIKEIFRPSLTTLLNYMMVLQIVVWLRQHKNNQPFFYIKDDDCI